MVFPGLITARIVFAVLVRGHKVAARRGAVLVNTAMGVAADTAGQGNALVLVFHFCALHAAVCGIQIHSELDRNFPDGVGLGFSPIESNAEVRAAGTAAQARMLFGVRTHRVIILWAREADKSVWILV